MIHWKTHYARLVQKIEGGNISTSDLNPAQNDYPIGPEAGQVALSSVPGNAPRDYNPGIDSDNFNQNYGRTAASTVSGEALKEAGRDRDRLVEDSNQIDSFALLSLEGGWYGEHTQLVGQAISSNGGSLI